MGTVRLSDYSSYDKNKGGIQNCVTNSGIKYLNIGEKIPES